VDVYSTHKTQIPVSTLKKINKTAITQQGNNLKCTHKPNVREYYHMLTTSLVFIKIWLSQSNIQITEIGIFHSLSRVVSNV